MTFPEHVSTERLDLRRSTMNDLEFFYSYATNPDVYRYMSWPAPTSKEGIQRVLEMMIRNWDEEKAFNYTLVLKEGTIPIGTIEPIVQQWKVSIGYLVVPEYWGKGYATEALCCIRDMVFEHAAIRRLWTVCDTENAASVRVLQKCGMQCEGILRKWRPSPNISPEPRDVYCYAMIT
jgi:ribosomal-protein-alanine N-acetyltransferase